MSELTKLERWVLHVLRDNARWMHATKAPQTVPVLERLVALSLAEREDRDGVPYFRAIQA